MIGASPTTSTQPRDEDGAGGPAGPGADHSGLLGGAGRFHFRPPRIHASELPYPLHCRFRWLDGDTGPLAVADISSTGIGVLPGRQLGARSGSRLDQLEVFYRSLPIWRGEGTVVYESPPPASRVGVRFNDGRLDLTQLQFGETLMHQKLERSLREYHAWVQQLPADWRAGVAQLRVLLQIARDIWDDVERRAASLDGPRSPNLRGLASRFFDEWAPAYLEQVRRLDAQAEGFDRRLAEAARRYAVKELMPLLGMDPTHHRAYAKPLGYAGDYRVIQLFFAEELEGDTLFGRFLHYVAQNYTLARTVRNREKHLRDHLRSCARAGCIRRVASLGSGPALEVQRLLREEEGFEQPLELFLVDQDEVALEHSHEALTRILLEERRGRLPVNVRCIHFSVRQLLEPRGEQELLFARKVLRDLDLVYSTGLFDYLPQPVARKLVNRSYEMLRPGGRLYIGNLERVPDTSWVMEYVLAWRLVYRTPAAMRDLARELHPAPAALEVVRDSTGHCLFLDLTRPA